ncbi:hypothetical_protein (plasmid) [Leishmania braziliensis MHOM/BR/75/M2904]|uniref:Hypothetical_protein n=1 Tax=Leishmania braziliensis MHOM/BR/75/M2904 TaxID=420245 RepID=A0A3P3YXU4_LEIBR|nr:hypothetical_protein [Leishmania braziliensis MHOM/BR/75/M2904]
MLSFRDIARTPDDADVLQTSLEELHRRRHAKQQQQQQQERERERQQREENPLLDEDAYSWSVADELSYRREVLNTWARQYPKLREAVASVGTVVSPRNAAPWGTADTTPAAKAAPVFSVVDVVRPLYPSLWRIPAGTIPANFYTHSAATVAVKDHSTQSCLVRVRWEAIRAMDPSGSIPHAQPQPQRVLARWPQGKPVSAKVAAVLRSIGIEKRNCGQCGKNVRWRQQQDEEEASQRQPDYRAWDHHSAASAKLFGNRASSADSAKSAIKVVAVNKPDSRVMAASAGVEDDGNSGGGSAADASESALGHELYWPAHITRIRALFMGAAYLQDTFHGLSQLQQYERFEPVLASALVSPLRIVVDVVYAIDETSEALGLSIDPLVQVDTTTSLKACKDAPTSRDCDGLRSTSLDSRSDSITPSRGSMAARRGTLSPREALAAVVEDECPVLLPSSLPPVLSDLNYGFMATSTTAGTAAGGSGTAESQRVASQRMSLTDDPITANAAALCRSTLSTSPLPLYTILAGPVTQTHSIVLLRPTPDVVCTARARALEELEQRWRRLRQALADRLVTYEEQAPTVAVVQSSAQATSPAPVLTTPPAATTTTTPSESLSQRRSLSPSAILTVELPDVDTYVSPLIDCSPQQDEGLPAKPAGAKSVMKGEMQYSTRVPQLQGGRLPRQPLTYRVDSAHDVYGRRLQLSFTSLRPSPADTDLCSAEHGAHNSKSRARSQPSRASQSPRGSDARDDGTWAAAAAPWSVPTPPKSPLPSQLSPSTPRQTRTPRADQGASSKDDGTTAAAAPHRDAMTARTPQWARAPVSPTSVCSLASTDGLDAPYNNVPFSSTEGLHSALPPHGRRAETEESRVISAAVRSAGEWLRLRQAVARAQRQPAASPQPHLPTLTIEPRSPMSSDAFRLANNTGRVSTAAATDFLDKAPSSSAFLPPRRRSHDGDDSPHHRRRSEMESCLVVIASSRTVPEGQPMTALQEACVTPHLSLDVHHTISDSAHQQSSTGRDGGGERVSPRSGRDGEAPPTLLQLHSRVSKGGTLIIPHLSTCDAASTPTMHSSTPSIPPSPPPHAASPSTRMSISAGATAQPHAEDNGQPLSSVRHTIRQQSRILLYHPDAASSRGNTTYTSAQPSATPPPVLSSESPLQRSPTVSSTMRESCGASDEPRSALTHISQPGKVALVDCKENEKAPTAPQAACATASASSSSGDDPPMLSGTAAYLSNILMGPLFAAAAVQRASASRRAGAVASSSPLPTQAAARESHSDPALTSGPQSSSLPASSAAVAAPRAHVHSVSSLPQQKDDAIASSNDRNHTCGAAPVTSPSSGAAVEKADPQRPRRQTSPLQSNTNMVGATTASVNHQVAQGGSSHTSDAVTSAESPLPRRPQSPAPPSVAGGNHDTREAASTSISPSSVKPQPSAVRADVTSAASRARGDPRLSSRFGVSSSSRKDHRHALPEAPKTETPPSTDGDAGDSLRRHQQQQQQHAGLVSVAVSRDVLSESGNREVELPEQPVRVSGGLTSCSTPQLQNPYVITANASVAAPVSSCELETNLENLNQPMHSSREELPAAHRQATNAIPSRTASTDVRSSKRSAHPRHRPLSDAVQASATSSSSPTLSASALPLPKNPRPAQCRLWRMQSMIVGSTGNEKLDGVDPVAPVPCRRHTAPPLATSSASWAFSDPSISLLSSWVASSRGTSPAPQASSHSSRSSRGGEGRTLVARSHQRTSSSQSGRQHHHDVITLSQSPSTTRRHRVLVRRVVRRHRSEVFVEEGGTLVYRAPMVASHHLRSDEGSGNGENDTAAPLLLSSSLDTRAASSHRVR